MTILSRLDGLHIRGLYFTESQRLTLGEVGLEEASGTGTGNIAYNVETCSCPPQYVGDSCQVGDFLCLYHNETLLIITIIDLTISVGD